MSHDVIGLFNQLAQNDFGFFQRVNSLADIMSRDIKQLTLDDKFEDVAEFFRKNRIHHAPVVEDGDVVGIVSDRDILRQLPPMLGTAAEGDDDHLALQTTVSQFMTRGPVALPVTSTPVAALTLMLDHHIDSVLVHDEQNELQGIITPRDFMKLVILFHQVCTKAPSLERLRLVDLDVSRGLPLDLIFSRSARSVRDVMTKGVRCLAENDSIETAIELMQSLQVRHLPVIDDSQRLIGLVTDREIVRFLPFPMLRQDSPSGFRDSLFAIADPKVITRPVTEIMDSDPPTIGPDNLLLDGIDVLMGKTISGIPVIDEPENRICGVLTTTDILRVIRIALQIGSLLNSTSQDAGTSK